MKRYLGGAFVAMLAAASVGTVRADEREAKAVLDRAIKALGGEAKLSRIKAFSEKSKGTISFNGNDNAFSGELTVQGLERYRSEFEGDFGGNTVKGVTVLDGKKGWRRFGDETMDMDQSAVANEWRIIYLRVAPILILPLKGEGFKIDTAADEKVDAKSAAVVKATGPDGKDFTLYFDKESGLPIMQRAKVVGFTGDEFTQETRFEDYKDFGGIKRATRSRSKRDGERFVEVEVTEFKPLDEVKPDTFAEPK